MKIRNLLILGMVLLGFTYCSSDEVLDGPTTGSGETADNLKMEITIQMPTGATTRTNTGDVTYQAGEANENQPNRVIVALYNKDNEAFVASYDSKDKSPTTGATFITTAEFKVNDLTVGKQYYVYAFVNPYSELNVENLNAIFKSGDTLDDAIALVTKQSSTESVITQDNFFMSNSEKVLTEPIQASHIQGAPLKVGVNVQRAVARMDYTADLTADGGHELSIGTTGVKVKFTHFKPMNASKAFYNLKHVNAGTDITANPTDLTAAIGVAEDNDNYVVDTDWATKFSGTDATSWKDSFHSYMGATTNDDQAAATAFQAKYTALADNFYITENTLPANQNNKKGVATAVVFKGKLVFAESDYGVTPSNEKVYVWNNKFYGVFANLPAGIKAIVADVDNITKDDVAALASAGVTGYSHDGTGYPVYYVYYNEHNENSATDGSVGAMEFGVVRNNIYQLSIKSLSKFGHPNDPELNPDTDSVDADGNPIVKNPDPSPQDPQDPIKSSELYMQVTATVLNWTVRTNEIEF